MMSTAPILAQHLTEFLHGNSMTGSHVKKLLEGVSMKEATTSIGNLNTISELVYHINYYIEAQLKVFREGVLDAHDSLSFNLPAITKEKQWYGLLDQFYKNIESYTNYVGVLSEDQLKATFVSEKYGSYHRNILGLSEHSHYHLGQIAILIKIIRNSQRSNN